MAKVLMIASCLPYPGVGSGGGVRMFNIISHLSQKHDLILLCFIEPEDESKIELLLPYCARVETVSIKYIRHPFPTDVRSKIRRMFVPPWTDDVSSRRNDVFLQKLNEILVQMSFDAFLVEFPEMGLYWNDLPEGPLKIYDSHEVRSVNLFRLAGAEHDLTKKLYYFSQCWKMRAYERWLCRSYDVILALTHKDEAYFQTLRPRGKVAFLPTGVDLRRFPPRSSLGQPNTIIYVGAYGNISNADAVEFFARQIFPRVRKQIPQARFSIVGANPTERVLRLAQEIGISVTGKVDDLIKALSQAAVFVAPIRLGGGIRGKLLEAMAVGVPVIASSTAVEGLGAQEGLHLLIRDKPQTFADAVICSLKNPSEAAKRSAAARQWIKQNFDWEKNIQVLMDILSPREATFIPR